MKSEILHHKVFLHTLYKGNPRQNANLIANANDSALNTLIKVLHLICNGIISLRKHDFQILKKSKLLNFLNSYVNTKDSYVKLLLASREDKIQILRKFSALYNSLLYLIFNLT